MILPLEAMCLPGAQLAESNIPPYCPSVIGWMDRDGLILKGHSSDGVVTGVIVTPNTEKFYTVI